MTLDGYESPIELRACLDIGDGEITVDFAGSSPLSTRGINSPRCYTEAYSVFGLKCIIAPAIPNNAGSLEPFRVLVEDGTLRRAAPARAGHRAARDRSDAAGSDVRRPRAGARRARAGGERGLDLGAADGGRARTGSRRSTCSTWGSAARGPGRARTASTPRRFRAASASCPWRSRRTSRRSCSG